MAAASNQRVRRTILLLTIAVTLCFILSGETASAAEQVDQSNLPEWAGGWTHVNPTGEGQATMWQTFRPGCPNLTAVEIDIFAANPGQGGDVLTVEIAKDEDILASAERSVEDGFDGLLRFEFPKAVLLVPEQIYELKVRDTGKTQFGWKYGPNTYERGSRYVFAQERPGTDWFFRTYSRVEPAGTKYSGGTGEPNDPYQIATAEDLMLLGETPADYDKHFILTADIDLDPNLPGRKVFDKAVIEYFAGVFDGNGHTISHLTINGKQYLGLFGSLGFLGNGAELRNLGVVDVNIRGSGGAIGGLVGDSTESNVIQCYSTGVVTGNAWVGGLVGNVYSGTVSQCHSASTVRDTDWAVGGLVGHNQYGDVMQCHSTGAVTGKWDVGGLVGHNAGWVHQCYSTAGVSGDRSVGGLVGTNWIGCSVRECYSIGVVSGKEEVGGLVGRMYDRAIVIDCFWDVQTSGQTTSAGGTGLTTTEMHDPNTFMSQRWDFVGKPDGPHDLWAEPQGGGYPILWWELSPWPELPRFSGGTGDRKDPYLISKPEELNSIGHNPRLMKCHVKLISDLDLTGIRFYPMGDYEYPYSGVFDGNDHTISHLTITGNGYGLGLFGCSGPGAEVKDLKLVDVNIVGSEADVGGLVGSNGGTVSNCHVAGLVTGSYCVGGLVGFNLVGNVIECYSTGAVSGEENVGGLVGFNVDGSVIECYSTGVVSGGNFVGGLVGDNAFGEVTDSYSTGDVSGAELVGGLVGANECRTGSRGGAFGGRVSQCYSVGSVSARSRAGGLVGNDPALGIAGCFWDTQTSGQATSAGGTGKTTAEMQMQSTFTDAGWDFVGETANGTEDIWRILEGKDYPRLWWER